MIEKLRILKVPVTAIIFFFLATSTIRAAVPPNDSCGGAIPMVIPSGGFGLGLFTGVNTDMTSATLQVGESFAPSIIVAGLNKKTVWYKFSLPTTRAARISLAQPGSGIQAGNVGFAVYKTSGCVPGIAEISTKFSPIEIFGSSYHPCVDAGDYLVQVTSNLNANGPIFITLELGEPDPAPYDKPADAFKFGDLTTTQQKFQDVAVSCQTIDNAAEVCLPNSSFKDYTKSIWYTFTTPAYFDYLNTWMAIPTLPYNTPSIKVGYRLYEGDATTTPLATLVQKGGCDSLLTDWYVLDKRSYRCSDLKPKTTYTVQLLFHKDFSQTIRVGTDWKGRKSTNGPLPVSGLLTPNKMGTLGANSSPTGLQTTVADVFGCNSRHSQNNCPKSMPVTGVLNGGVRYNLSSFVSFNLAATSSIFFNANVLPCNGQLLLRLYKQTLTANCADLDTSKLVGTFSYSTYSANPLSCLDAGDYVLQVMAVDSFKSSNTFHHSSLASSAGDNYLCFNNGLGSAYNLLINVRTEVAINRFALDGAGKVNKMNTNSGGVMQPLSPDIPFRAKIDTFGCVNTVLPDALECLDNFNQPLPKATYREFVLQDSVMVFLDFHNTWNSKLYKGDAEALTTAQNKHTYPEKFTGLVPYSKCLHYYNSGVSPYACAVPGTYTFVQYDNRLSHAATVEITAKTTKTKHSTPATAQDLGDLWSYVAPNGWHQSDLDTFTCRENPVTIDGIVPCNSQHGIPSTKLIYRQFYLSKASGLSIYNYIGFSGEPFGNGVFTLFSGKGTDGIGTLKKVSAAWTCFARNSTAGQCDVLPAGWYTVVSYASGPSYANPLGGMPSTETYQRSGLGTNDKFMIQITGGCAAPKFNRPFKASVDTVTKKPYLIEWAPQPGHTTAYPVTSKTYTLNKENFDCSIDSVFIKANLVSCQNNYNKVAFYVFQVTQSSYVQISNFNGAFASVFNFDVRTADSVKLKTTQPLQKCTDKTGRVDFCQLQPGIYTLVLFVPDSWNCSSIAPSIYIDQVGFSRFDHAANAYDFGTLLPDSTWRYGKVGDVNPLNSGRAPTNDFFYCTTGAQEKDPTDATCGVVYNPNIYPSRNNAVINPDAATTAGLPVADRRNLWYSFVVNNPGTVMIKVENKTLNKALQYSYAVYKSDVDASIPFNALKANGLVDSTLIQGLQLVGTNPKPYYCGGQPSYWNTQVLNINVPPCDFTPTRYYILVETVGYYGDPWYHAEAMIPNHQVEVSALLDSVNAVPPKFDHYSKANDMGLVNSGIKKGEVDNFTCATRDLADPLYSYTTCQKTLWYKFTTTVTGQVRYTAHFKNSNNYYYDHIQLFRQIRPNDSSATGLQHLLHTSSYSNNGTWAQQCISPGTYYIILPGCNAVNEDVYPQIEIIPQAGDFCSAPMISTLNGAGSKVVPVTVDCHTIGTDYGEFNPTLTCPAGAVTANYKTSWYRLDITGTDTLDVTIYINEKTNAGSTDIKYRMMTGTCGAMQEQSCVQDALTRNTYKCLAPGNSYYIQVFSPLTINGAQVIGDIDLNIAAVTHADTCLPASACIGVANFTPQFDCTKDKNVVFTNFSTFGSSIQYDWDFGYNNQRSNSVSPAFFYPALTIPKTYSVKLVVTNLLCGKKDSSIQNITIPARAAVDLGKDTTICASGSTLTLDATTHAGSTYYWYNGSTSPSFITSSSNNSVWVEVSYGSCKTRDTIAVLISPIARKSLQTKALCAVTQVTLDASRGQGEVYQWSTGAFSASIIVSQPGYYWADVYWKGCIVRDSFLVVSSSLQPLGNATTLCQAQLPYKADATVSGASSYSWQDGSTNAVYNVTKAGLYWVDINLSGCSFRDTLIIEVDSFKTSTISRRICQGQNYLLPSGKRINTTGTFTDSLKNVRGCDSLITTLTLVVDTVASVSKAVSLCAGEVYQLPGGRIVSTAGTFTDTVRNTNGCDSLISQVTLSFANVLRESRNASICAGKVYTLPSGKNIFTAGIYIDTVKAKAGCDSLVTTFDLTVLTPVVRSNDTSICAGNNYTLPSGLLANVAGVYRDTLRNVNGCDSILHVLTLTVNAAPSLGADKLISFCAGNPVNLVTVFPTSGLTQSWKLGDSVVNTPATIFTPGNYQLIANNLSGCADTANVTVNVVAAPNLPADKIMNACLGSPSNVAAQYNTTGLSSTWTLNGVSVSNPSAVYVAGDYRLIVSNDAGCTDTAIVGLTVNPKPLLGQDKSSAVCSGDFANLTNLFVTTDFASTWTHEGAVVPDPTAVGIGTYQLIVSNAWGCSDTALATVAPSTKPNLGNDQGTSICQGSVKNLLSIFNTTGLASNWSFNGSALTNPSAVSAPGTYRLVVTNTAGCTDTAFVVLSVEAGPAVGIDKSVTVCAGTPVNLNTQFNTTAFVTKWNLNGTPIANPSAISATGNYQVVVSNSNGCTDTAMVYVMVNSKPSLGPDQTLSTCIGSSIDLTTKFVTTGLNTGWKFGSMVISDPKSISTPGTYQLIVSNTFGCSDTAVVNLSIYQDPTLKITDPPAVCTPAAADITSTSIVTGSAPGLTYTYWSDPSATMALVNPRAVVSGVYYIKGSDLNGCASVQPVQVLVHPFPMVNAGKDTTICNGDFAVLTGTSSNFAGGTIAYLWTPTAGLGTPAAATTTARPGITVTYTLSATVTYPTCTLTVSDDVTVNVRPPVQAFAGNDTIAVAGVPHQLMGSGGASYLWSPSGSLSNAAIANPLATLFADTRFTIRVTDMAGCVGSATVLVKVYAGITYYVPNAFSPNGDGLNDVFRPTPAGIVSTNYFRIFSRYGELIFETSQLMKGWDGTFKGAKQPVGNYVWAIKGIGRDGKSVEMKGNVLLVR